MKQYDYRLLNVFAIAGDRFSGNPLCVFEDGRGIDDKTMQALALQFNLSETTFILPSSSATARVRIFTPTFEMPFAGHPTLGTANVVRQLKSAGDRVTLEMQAGIIPVVAAGNSWTLQAGKPTSRAVEASKDQLAQMLGLKTSDIGDTPLWVNTGSEQLIVPLTSAEAIDRVQPVGDLLKRYGSPRPDRYLAHVWARGAGDMIRARFFFGKGNSVAEDPATGSACANLGGWFLATQAPRPLSVQVDQGSHIGRPSRLGLKVDAEGAIFVSGDVIEFGSGTVEL
jgi:PhzF family phenazine biosynthesis protein